ncbi:MAG: bcr, partial [Frankiales bacterium]|nr:bcr [Frankiales bacterium]
MQQRPRLLLLGWLTATVAFAIDGYLPALPQVRRDLHTTTAATNLTLTALLLGLAVGQLVGGSWSDAVGRRRPILIGLAGYAVTAALCAVAPDVTILVGLRALQGLFGSIVIVVTRAVVRDCWEGAEAAQVFAKLLLVFGAAPVLAPLLGAQVLRVTSWRGIFVLLAVQGLVLGLAALRGLPETLPPERRKTGGLGDTTRSFGLLVRDRHYVLVTAAAGLGYGSLFVYLSGSSFTLQQVFDLSPQQFALSFGANGAAFVATSQIGAALVPRTGARALMLTGASVQVLAGATLVAGDAAGAGLTTVLIGFALVTSSLGLVTP